MNTILRPVLIWLYLLLTASACNRIAMVVNAAEPLELDFSAAVLPVPRTAKLELDDYFVWCGTMTRTDDGKCHLFFSRWPRKLGHNAWVTHSEICYAVADEPLGPYRFVSIALPTRGPDHWDGMVTHNPNVIRVGRKFCLYYTGNTGDGKSFWVHRNHQRVGVALADSPAGPWQRFDRPVVDISPEKAAFDSLCTTNPAATERPDGGILLIYKAVADNGTQRGGSVRFGAAVSRQPQGPFVKQPGRVFEPSEDDGKTWMLAEDPFIWYSDRFGKRYYALARDVVGSFTKSSGSLALFQSADGVDWKLARHALAMGPDFLWADGARSGTKLERPQLYLEDGLPKVLFGAVDVNQPTHRAHSFNVHIPLSFGSP